MRRRLLCATAALAALTLAAGALPALTADSGTVTLSITIQAAASPCLTVGPAAVDFDGPKAFSTPSAYVTSDSLGTVTLTNCGTVPENISEAGTDAAGPSGSWALTQRAPGNPCSVGTDAYFLWANAVNGAFQSAPVSRQPTVLRDSSGQPAVWNGGASTQTNFTLFMPCQGSNGAGETKTFSINYTAVGT
jgi:hypothetical protein